MSISDVARNRGQQLTKSQGGAFARAVERIKRPKDKRWEFSFRYFRQIDKFGLDGKGIPNDWLVSFLERLQQLSLESLENILENQTMAEAYRYHPINWSAKNVPLARGDIDWIGEPYKSNPEEFPIEQLMLSKGTGRFVGFFDENWVFNLVLVDPLHNLQPSKDFGYAVNPSSPLHCELTHLQLGVKQGLEHCTGRECAAAKSISEVLLRKSYSEPYGVVLMKFNEKVIADAQGLMTTGAASSYADIFEAGLCFLAENKPTAGAALGATTDTPS